jgi:hypothetical protein
MAKSQYRIRTFTDADRIDADSAAAELMTAHIEIMDAWFAQWANQERSRIDLVFKKVKPSEHRRKQTA